MSSRAICVLSPEKNSSRWRLRYAGRRIVDLTEDRPRPPIETNNRSRIRERIYGRVFVSADGAFRRARSIKGIEEPRIRYY